MLKKLGGWGNYPVLETELQSFAEDTAVSTIAGGAGSLIGRGLGRSYGDSALGRLTLSTLRFNAMLSFDENSGVLVAEAGVSLDEIIRFFSPRGWFPPVTPGTRFVTLGGAAAADVHGKNHHVAGSFARHVHWLDIWTASAGIVRCSPHENAGLFWATCGGLGLTGVILRVALGLIRVPSLYIAQTMIKSRNISESMDVFEQYAHLPFSVSWIDCLKANSGLGRGIFMGGSFSAAEEPQKAAPYSVKPKPCLDVPLHFPSFALNPLSCRAFNALYYARAPKGTSHQLVDHNAFFYPLDAIGNWNRIYGRRGFTQYQFVLPLESAREGLPRILAEITRMASGSFLAVLKLFGEQPDQPGNISFPRSGYTLALDFPIRAALFPCLDRLDAMVLDYGGRHYLAKDARLSAAALAKSYGRRLSEFLDVKRQWDPDGLFRSLQSDRLGLTT